MLVSAQSEAKDAPVIPPYSIPSFDGLPRDFKKPIAPIKPAKKIDADELFMIIVNCFPERVGWGIDVDLVAGLRMSENNGISTFDSAGLSKHYIGIVAKMPLYSATELTAERTKEFQRRSEVSANVAALLKSVADRRRAERELGLFSSLEARSQARVAVGVVDVNEQVSYLEKVVTAQSALDSSEAAIEGARLALAGQCRDEMTDTVNDYIIEAIR